MVYLLVLALIRLVECTNRTIHSKSGVRSAGSPIVVSDIVHASGCHSSYAHRWVVLIGGLLLAICVLVPHTLSLAGRGRTRSRGGCRGVGM